MNHTKEYSIDFSEININAKDIGKIIGYHDKDIPEMVMETIDDILEELIKKCKLQGGYKVFENISIKNDLLMVENVEFKTKKIISNSITNSDSIAILVSTAGKELSEWSNELFYEDYSLKGYIADITASILVEKTADLIQYKIEKEAESNFMKITNRYSPGYCGWDITEQHKLFSLLSENFCGISLTDMALMIPIKSISAIIGIGDKVEKKEYKCNACEKTDCLLALDKN